MYRVLAQKLEIIDIGFIEGQAKGFDTIGSILNKAVPFVFGFAGLGLLLMILSAGFALLTSAGDAKKLEAGKQRLTYAIVGFLVIFTAYWAVQLAGTIFGVAEIQSVFK